MGGDERLVAEPGRLDAVAARLAGIPRADVQRAIADGRVRVDGESVLTKSHRLAGGETLQIEPDPAGAELAAEGPAVPVRYEDDALAVVAKPAGLVTHPTPARRSGTLVNRLLGMGMPLAPGEDPLRPGIVHRLDAGTSGLLVIAKDEEAREAMAGVFRRHEADRRYLALVRGDPDHDRFEVEAPLGRRESKVVVDRTRGRAASTVFEVRERFGTAALLEARPRTGRTHQIRVHLAATGLPIVGDRTYGGGGDLARRLGLDRPFLHAYALSFDHPSTGERIELSEPLPEDLSVALDRLREANGAS